ncbi:MAG: hypothetical protein ACT4OM_11750 [Actinomycetota bacterium]
MSSEHVLTDDIVYDLVSIQYHSLKSGDVYDRYLADCHEHEDVAAFIRQCQSEDAARVERSHELIQSVMHKPEPAMAAAGGGRSRIPMGEKVTRWR